MSGNSSWILASGSPDHALAEGAVHRARQQHPAGAQRRHDIVEHGLEHRRHAGQDMDVADEEAGRHGDRIVDMGRAFGHARHALARVGEFQPLGGVVIAEQPQRLGVVVAGQAEGLGDGFGGDVVMRRPDAAGGEGRRCNGRAAR